MISFLIIWSLSINFYFPYDAQLAKNHLLKRTPFSYCNKGEFYFNSSNGNEALSLALFIYSYFIKF